MPITRLSIIGVGLLGGSVGLAVKSRLTNCRVIGYGIHSDRLNHAVTLGAIDGYCLDLAEAVRGADLIMLAVPAGQFPQILQSLSPHLSPETIVTDVASIKAGIVAPAERLLPWPARFVGGHPIAGGERSGVEHASASLFIGASCILTPTATTDTAAVEVVDGFWRALGAEVCRMSPQEHDRIVARISHLPHLLAGALISMQSESTLALAGRGLADMTRIAAGDATLWRDILIGNRAEVKASIAELRSQLDTIEAMIDHGNAPGIEQFLQAAAARRRAMP